MTLKDLFIDWNCSSISECINFAGNRIDWYTEMLYDDPWNTIAQVSLDCTKKILSQLEILDSLDGADIDIEPRAIHIG